MSKTTDFLNRQYDLVQQTKNTYSFALKKFEELAEKPFEEVYLDSNMVHKVLNLLSEQVSESSWNTYLSKYKRYAKWLYDPEDETPPKFWRKIRPIKIDWEKKLKDKWLTKKQFYRLLDVIDYPRDRALFCVCVEGGLRAGELLGLRIRDVKQSSYGFDITVSGKTGSSSFPVVLFAPLLKHWLNFHPFKDDPDSPLWIKRKCGTSGLLKEPLSDDAVYLALNKYSRRAGLGRISLHWLRHSKITWTAKNSDVRVSDEMAKKMFRWSKNSRMFSHYTHLHGVDTNNTFLALAGVKQEKEQEEEDKILDLKVCFNCNEKNSATMLYCGKCGFVLSEEEAQKKIQEEKKRKLQEKRNEAFMKLAIAKFNLEEEYKKQQKKKKKEKKAL